MSFSLSGPEGVNYDPAAVGPLVTTFIESSRTYPDDLIGVSVAVGNAAMGEVSWGEFAASEVTGDQLDVVVAEAIAEHDKVRFRGNDRLTTFVPIVYQLTKGNIATTITNLWSDAEPQLLDSSPVTQEQLEAARSALYDRGDTSHRQAATGALFAASAEVLHTNDEALAAAADFRGALTGNSSPNYPGARRIPVPDKRLILATNVRPLLVRSLLPVAADHGLTAHQAINFAHNITRP